MPTGGGCLAELNAELNSATGRPVTPAAGGLAAGLRSPERGTPFARRYLTSPGLRYVVRRILSRFRCARCGRRHVPLLRLIPGDPARTLLGLHAPSAAVAALRHQLGLDEADLAASSGPTSTGSLIGNLGTSIYYQPVASVIAPGLP